MDSIENCKTSSELFAMWADKLSKENPQWYKELFTHDADFDGVVKKANGKYKIVEIVKPKKKQVVVRTYEKSVSELDRYLQDGWIVVFANYLGKGTIQYILEKEVVDE